MMRRLTGRCSMSAPPPDPAAPVLVPVDFSAGSAPAHQRAAQYARRSRLPLVILHVVHDPGAAPGSYAPREAGEGLRPLDDVGRELLEEFLAECRERDPDLPTAGEVRLEMAVGLPANRILEVAQALGAGHIVMGSRGRTGLSRLLLGSKAERVVQLSPVPVTIVKVAAAADPEVPAP